ncbi:purine-nucleoside phosphorylase [Nannocystaceae bacterium ST9]
MSGFDPNWHPEGAVCAKALRERLPGLAPVDWLIIGGSGIGRPLVEQGEHGLGLRVLHSVALAELGLPAPSVPGHGSALVIGELDREGGGAPIRVAVQTGRIHPYEGHSVGLVCAPLGAMFEVGVGRVLLTAAVGGVDPMLRVGAIVSFRDQMALFAPTPLRGAAFVDCSNLYDRELRKALRQQAGDPSILPEVVYGHARGPQYESPAEVAALRLLGADVVGMSTTYEAILAAAHRVPCCGLGVVTNAAGSEALSHVEVERESIKARGRLVAILRKLIQSA